MTLASTDRLSPARAFLLAGLLLVFPAGLATTAWGQHQLETRSQPKRILGAANYFIRARLTPETKTVSGEERVLWNNQTDYATQELRLHLYLNAFKNRKSTFARELGRPFWSISGPIPDDYWGWIKISSIEVLQTEDTPPNNITSSSFQQPDDGNPDDETVLKLDLANPVPPGESIRLLIQFESKLPRGVARTGWTDDYFFGAQWFPKLGVFEDGTWNCHQYHANTEYYADFGSYQVQLTVPEEFMVGGSGPAGRRNSGDGTTTYGFEEDQIHDFAWVASPRFLIRSFRFATGRLPNVSIRLLLLPEHEHLADRYTRAVISALEHFGRWFGPYPYPQLTIVDPAYNSDTDGMEYPTLITGRARYWSPPEALELESTTVHEVAHQWWYGVVANNEVEEAWLDEGLASFSESLLMSEVYPEAVYTERFLGGIPFTFDILRVPWETSHLARVRRFGTLDRMTQPSWKTFNSASYGVNAYAKPELTLWTLQRLLGKERMLELLRAYFERYSFNHASTEDFIRMANGLPGWDLEEFFQETFHSSELIDYSIAEASSELISEPDDDPLYRSQVLVRRERGARLPVEVSLVFADGEEVRELWDGRDRWQRFVLDRPVKLERAVVDPDRKILLDINPVNNSRLVDLKTSGTSLATHKWSSKWLFWVQNLLESFAFIG